LYLFRANPRKNIVESCICEGSDWSYTEIAEHGRIELVDKILVDTKVTNFSRVVSSKISTTLELSQN